MERFRAPRRIQSLMIVIVLSSIVMTGAVEAIRVKHRWQKNRWIAAEHSRREVFFRRLARRFDELADVEVETAASEGVGGRDAAEHSAQGDSLRRAAAQYAQSADGEARLAGESLRRW